MEELKQNIMNDISNSKLPADCLYYLLKDIYRDYEIAYMNYLAQEKVKKQEKENNTEV